MPATTCVILNGDSLNTSSSSLAELVAELKLDQRVIAIELNLEVVPKSAYVDKRLSEGDRIEIVHMIGGG